MRNFQRHDPGVLPLEPWHANFPNPDDPICKAKGRGWQCTISADLDHTVHEAGVYSSRDDPTGYVIATWED
jgi:hypothetical protein